MRKLLAVTAVLALIALLYGCGGSSDQSESTQEPVAEYKPSKRPTATNIAAFWERKKGKAPRVEVSTFSGKFWVNSSATDVFTTTAKGVRLERAPKVEIYKLRVWYAKQTESYSWDGEGLLPLTKSITSPISGKQHKRQLVRIKAYLYSPRIGNAVPMRFYCNGCDNSPRSSDPPRSSPYSG